MNTQNENTHYDHQSFDHYPTSPLYPAGWDLSSLLSTPQPDSDSQVEYSTESDSEQA